MKTTHHALLLALALALCATARAQAPAAALRDAQKAAAANAAYNLPGIPALPVITPYYDAKAYAWVWTPAAPPPDPAQPAAQWTLIPRNNARILYNNKDDGQGMQITGTLWIDGCYDVPVVSGQNVILLFRKLGNFKRFEGLPASESGFEVIKLAVRDGPRKGQLIRTAPLKRLGEAAASFGAAREPITVQVLKRQDGVFHAVQVTRPLAPGRYALYLPDRAFEFEVR